MSDNFSNLSDRARDIFRLVVESYLDNGSPVGSRTLSKISTINLSPASIRNVMQDLEETGLLAAPHTSAGRIPTQSGLRLFVDGMMQAAEPSAEERAAIEAQVKHDGPVEEALSAVSSILSGLSDCAGLIMVPQKEAVLNQFSFVRLSPTQALAVLVGADGNIENRIVDISPQLSDTNMAEAANYMSERLSGMTLSEAIKRLDEEITSERAMLDKVSADLVRKGLVIWSSDANNRPILIVKGQSNLIDDSANADLDMMRQLFDDLENKEAIAKLIDGARVAQSTKIFIGSENNLFSLSGSSVIAAPYREEGGKIIGVVGVIGPTRLNYARIVPMVDFTAQTLSRLGKI